jgi:exodeoxyribonuclease-5
VTLNQGQQAAAEGFFEFLFSDQPELIISGPGGVGKTFLMSHMIDEIMPRYFSTCQMLGIQPEYDEVRMTATTNKAAEVLAVATKRPTETVHSFLNLKVKDDWTTGEQKLLPTLNWTVHERKIVFIDECSMIDGALLDYIRKGTHKSKVIYVGDHCQLAPVKEPISPIYRHQLPFYELTEQMRNSEQPALMNLCNQLRHTVETGEFFPIQIIPGVIDWLDDSHMQRALDHVFASQTHESRILAYTNQKVLAYNDYIRGIRNLPDEFTVGEFVVNNSALQLRQRMISVEEEFTITHLSKDTFDIPIEDNVYLTVREATLESRIGDTFSNVPIPVDRSHYTALLNYYRKQKNWPRYFSLKDKYPDLRQRDAATVHKSQGSTYDTVFIDLGNISTCHNPSQVARMLYVAVSRPRTRIFFYGELAQKYGGLCA